MLLSPNAHLVPKMRFSCAPSLSFDVEKALFSQKFCIFAAKTINRTSIMEYQALNESARMVANDKKRSIYIDKVNSGMPRWLIEVAFVLFVLQALYTEEKISEWVIDNGLQPAMSLIILVGDVIFFYAMMRGMKTLVRPFTVLWCLLIVVVAAGDIAFVAPDSIINLVLAVALPLVYLPLGFSITYFYRGRLQWVGILMIAHMVAMIILPILLYPFIPNIIVDIVGIVVLIAFGWTMRQVLVGC